MPPIKDFLEKYDFGAEGFDAEKFRTDALAEFTNDETAWQAAVAERDTQIAESTTALDKSHAENWKLLQRIPTEHDNNTSGRKPEQEQSKTPTYDDIFKPRKKD